MIVFWKPFEIQRKLTNKQKDAQEVERVEYESKNTERIFWFGPLDQHDLICKIAHQALVMKRQLGQFVNVVLEYAGLIEQIYLLMMHIK